MHTKRIIPCLDVKDGRVVKGINFVNFKDAGDPVEAASFYNQAGADELVFLDITASHENRKTILNIVSNTAEQVFIPFTVGGGIRTIEDIRNILSAGADKVSINSPALNNPNFIDEAAQKFGSQCIVVAIDAKRKENGKWEAFSNGGRINTHKDALEWAIEAESRGAGEILLTSMDCDGTKNGYDIELTNIISNAVKIPVIASGGAGTKKHFLDVFKYGNADAALAASLFHYRELDILDLKQYLIDNGVSIRL